MANNNTSNKQLENTYSVYGTIRDQYHRPLEHVKVVICDKDIRSEQVLGETTTERNGNYSIKYSRKSFDVTDKQWADIIVRVYDKKQRLLKESSIYYNAAYNLEVNIELSEKAYVGRSEFDTIMQQVKEYTGDLALHELTEQERSKDVTFLVNKTGLPENRIEKLAMAHRFENYSKVPAESWYGMLRENLPDNLSSGFILNTSMDFEKMVASTYNSLLHTDVNTLVNAVRQAIEENIISYTVAADLEKIKAALVKLAQSKTEQDDSQRTPSALYQKLKIGGITDDEMRSFIEVYAGRPVTDDEFWRSAKDHPGLTRQESIEKLQAVFHLSRITKENLRLTEHLMDSEHIRSRNDLKKLAKYTRHDWEKIVKDTSSQSHRARGENEDEQIKSYATLLENNFTRQFPTSAFAARLGSDATSKLPHRELIGDFLDRHEHFDLLHTRIGTFLDEHRDALPNKERPEVAEQLRRLQRVFKIAPAYAPANALLEGNIHSAKQVYQMGKDNFVRDYGEKIGKNEAEEIFEKASHIHAAAVAYAGNIKSLSDASMMPVFPDYNAIVKESLTKELPDLETLFGHADYCACDECNSVYGAAAYLTDMLHYMDKRMSSLNCAAGKNASVKDLFLRRRADIGDIDLECDNTNTEVPYIDIACEIMEDYVSPPVVSIAATFLPKLSAGIIDNDLLIEINSKFDASGQTNISDLLTEKAKISESFKVTRLTKNDTCVTETHWMIRDQLLSLKATHSGGPLTIRLLHQTLLSSAEISANPEYVNVKAYDELKKAKRPFTLPFDLFGEESELYLEKLGLKKYELIDLFRPAHEPAPAPSATDLRVAFAYLGISNPEQAIIFTQDLANQTDYWGTAAGQTSLAVNIFQSLTNLDYQGVLDLIELQFINPAGDTKILHDDLSCDTGKQYLTNLTPGKFDAIHRFLRLKSKVSFTQQELDALIKAFGNKIDSNFAWQLHHFLSVQRMLSVDIFQLLAFYSELHTTGAEPLYDALFQNRSITNPVDPDFAAKQVAAGALNLSDAHKAVVIAALGISLEDLQFLLDKTDQKLSLVNLSYLYRHIQISQLMELPLKQLFILIDLLNTDPFKGPVHTARFLDQYRVLKSSGFLPEELDYIIRHQNDANSTLIPAETEVLSKLSELQNGLLVVNSETEPAADTNGTLMNKWLSNPLFQWDALLLQKLTDLLGTSDDDEYLQKLANNTDFLIDLRIRYNSAFVTADLSTLPVLVIPEGIAERLVFDSEKRHLRLAGYMNATELATLLGLSANSDYQTAINTIYNKAQLTDSGADNVFFTSLADIDATLKTLLSDKIAERFAFFINKIAPVFRKLLSQELLIKLFSAWFKYDKKMVVQLLSSIPATFTELTDLAFVNKTNPLTAANYPDQYKRYLLTAKISFVSNKLKLNVTDLSFLVSNSTAIETLDFLTLPLLPVTGPVTSFEKFSNLVDLLKFGQYHPMKITDTTTGAHISIYTIIKQVLDAEPIADIEKNLVFLTDWKKDDFEELTINPGHLGLVLTDDLRSPQIIIRLHNCFVGLSRIGATAANAVKWTSDSLGFDEAVKIKSTLKSRYEDADWLEVTRPLQDKLREKKRDALIAFLLTNAGSQKWHTDRDLYSYFLLDVEMCACQPTSRIVQATNSGQLFIQRCFMNLENFVTVDSGSDQDWLHWKWMKNYRVWQANVKVFLYPENWIEPELLPKEIKSPFLKELENELLQNEVTETNVEDAFMNYLEKLDGVARLEVKGMWYDDPTKTLHVFARTYGGDPKTYFYRKFIENRRWTPWLKVDLEINSDHIVPVVYNNRIYLFWGLFTSVAAEVDSMKMPDTTVAGADVPLEKPAKHWQIQLAFSEYKNGKWSPKKISGNDSTDYITYEQYFDPGTSSYLPNAKNFLFAALDMPRIDFSDIFNEDGSPRKGGNFVSLFLQNIKTALSENGKLNIHCYYYTDTFTHVGCFNLDPCRGYPVVTEDYAYIKPWMFDRSGFYGMLDMERFETSTNNALSLSSNNILTKTPGIFRNLTPLQMGFIDRLISLIFSISQQSTLNKSNEMRIPNLLGTFMPYFYQDQHRTYYAAPEISDNAEFEFFYSDLMDLFFAYLDQNQTAISEIMATLPEGHKLFILHHYYNFYHPLVCHFMRQLFTEGVDGLMKRETQLKGDIAFDPNPAKFSFQKYYDPTSIVYSGGLQPVTYPNGVVDTAPGHPRDDVDFSMQSGYGLYNWELFFHAPLMIAERLSQNQQFDAAERWYKYIFDPTDSSSYPSPDKYWVTKPFFLNVNDKYVKQRIENIMLGINADEQKLVKDVADWRDNPFQPHYIAQYRTVAYQKTAVMKFVGHLIRRGDYLFRQHTMESVTEATQLYILAAEVMGPQPQIIPPAHEQPVDTYYQLEKKLDAFSNAMVAIENLMPLHEIKGYNGVKPVSEKYPSLETLYFCIPMNEKMVGPTGYWSTIADRLFKIRHCLDIEGTFAPLSLFAPPIDPGMLVRAAAAGLDLGSVLNDMNAPLPVYRFKVMIEKATELCDEVKSLGSAMLSALEKKDAESLSLLRSSHEIKLLNAMLVVKQKQVLESQAALDNLKKQKELITIRDKYYQRLVDEGWNTGEQLAFGLNVATVAVQIAGGVVDALAAGLHQVPEIQAGASGIGGSPHVSVKYGGGNLGHGAASAAAAVRAAASALQTGAAMSATAAGYARREEEWRQQLTIAKKELEQVDKQILGAEIRLDMSNQEVLNQQLQIDNAKASDDFMRSKFTNEELYSWMINQLSITYFRSYQLAYDIAKRTERCFRYELGLPDSAFINFGYWDSLKKGLLSGEQLFYDLKKMEMAYYEQRKREYELTKHISISQLDPIALLKLKENGECWVNLPEEVFDMDHPGHYMRRFKSVSVSIPCIAGPFATISCKMTMTKNSTRVTGIAANDPAKYARKMSNGIPADDPRFRDATGSVQSIVTSTGQNDPGLFEMNLEDERYLPFEGAGAISLWHIQLPAALPQFDYDTISDVIIHLKYTAREGGEMLKADAVGSINSKINQMLVSTKDKGLMRIIRVKNDIPTEWHKFMHPANDADDQVLSLNLGKDRFPIFTKPKTVKIKSVHLVAESSLALLNGLILKSPAPTTDTLNLSASGIYGNMLSASKDYGGSKKNPGIWELRNPVANVRITENELSNLAIVIQYEIT